MGSNANRQDYSEKLLLRMNVHSIKKIEVSMQRMSRATFLVSVGILSLSLALGGCSKKDAAGPPPGAAPEVGVITMQPSR
jgi:hypothetical protein